LDLRGIDHRHEPDPQFRAALQHRVRAIVAGIDPGPVTDARDLTTVHLEPTRSRPSPLRNRRQVTQVILAATAVVAIALVATRVDDDATPAHQPSPTVTAPATRPMRPPPTTDGVQPGPTTTLAPRAETVSFTVTDVNRNVITGTAAVPTNWWSTNRIFSGLGVGSAEVSFDIATNIYADGCQWKFVDPPVGPTVDDLVAAWADVPELAATAPLDVTVDGYDGKQIELTVPNYTAGECRETLFGVFSLPFGVLPGVWADGPNQHFKMWVLDIDGTRLVISASTFPSTSPQDRAALDDILASIQIGADVTSPLVDVRERLSSGADVERSV
jgi:hypothetical protein